MKNEYQILVGDVREQLRTLPDQSVDCVVTSPPYWNLRDYETGSTDEIGSETLPDCLGWATGQPCGICYICHLVDIFHEVYRVLRNDGNLWLNLGDCYPKRKVLPNLNKKNLLLLPARAALALQNNGWILRYDNWWIKPNTKPESVSDRLVMNHEYIFHFVKKSKYFFDWIPLGTPTKEVSKKQLERGIGEHHKHIDGAPGQTPHSMNKPRKHIKFGGNKYAGLTTTYSGNAWEDKTGLSRPRGGWIMATASYKGSHFAVFPEELPRRCILLSTPEGGCCEFCGKPYQRIKTETSNYQRRETTHTPHHTPTKVDSSGWEPATLLLGGWVPACSCNSSEPVPATVLDPFMGSGTTLVAAWSAGRKSIGIDLSPQYAKLAEDRLQSVIQRRGQFPFRQDPPAQQLTFLNLVK